MARELTLKRQKLVAALPTASTKLEAARTAGFKGSDQNAVNGVNLALKNPEVQAALKAEAQSLAERSGVTPEWALRHLKDNVERSMQAYPVLDRKGNPTGEYAYEPNAVNKGVELALRFNQLLGGDTQQPQGGFTFTLNIGDKQIIAVGGEAPKALLGPAPKRRRNAQR